MSCETRGFNGLHMGEKGRACTRSDDERAAQQDVLRGIECVQPRISSQVVRLGNHGKHCQLSPLDFRRAIPESQAHHIHLGRSKFPHWSCGARFSLHCQPKSKRKQMENQLPTFCTECSGPKPCRGLLAKGKELCQEPCS